MNPRNMLTCLTALILTSCGGGGGGNDPATTVAPTTPVATPTPNAPGSVTLTWIAPTTNVDGSTPASLTGFRLYESTHPNTFTFEPLTTLTNPGLATFVVENLDAGPHYFSITAINQANLESEMSNVAGAIVE